MRSPKGDPDWSLPLDSPNQLLDFQITDEIRKIKIERSSKLLEMLRAAYSSFAYHDNGYVQKTKQLDERSVIL